MDQAFQNRGAQQQVLDKIDHLKRVVEQAQLNADSAKKYPDELRRSLLEEKKKIPENPWREINGVKKYVKADPDFATYWATVVQSTDDGILVKIDLFETELFLKHYPFRCGDGAKISFTAVNGGLYAYETVLGARKTVSSLDYGVPCERPENGTQVEIEAQQLNKSDNQQITNAIKDAASKQDEVDAAQKALQDFLDTLNVPRRKAIAEESGQPSEQDTNTVTQLPLVGDETSVSAILADAGKFSQQPIVICGSLPVSDYYRYRYSDSSKPHFTLDFIALTEDMQPDGKLPVDVGQNRIGTLVEEILNAQQHGMVASKIVRLKVIIKKLQNGEPHENGSFYADGGSFYGNAVLIDWQFMKSDGSGWDAWANEKIGAATKKAAQDRTDRVVKYNQEEADKGDPYGLLRMGERYRDGDGVEKDLTKARDYFSKAVAAGSPSAAGELSQLNQVLTNSPATK